MEHPQTPALPEETEEQRDIRVNKDTAAFGYIWIMSVAVYASRRDSPFVQYHSKQGIVLFLLSIPSGMIPWVGKYLMLLLIAGMLLGFINAAQGLKRDVPIAGPISRGEMKVSDLINLMTHVIRKTVEIVKQTFKSNTPPSPQPPAQKNTPAV